MKNKEQKGYQSIRDVFHSHNGRAIYKIDHFLDVYDRYLSKFVGTDVCVLEIGVSYGGSLQIWKEFFGDNSKIFGIDINPSCKKIEEDRIKVFIGDQENRKFMRSIVCNLPKLDIVIDDGGHRMKQQIATFEELFPFISKNGIYICEDLETSYDEKWNGGIDKTNTFVEYSKKLIDSLHTSNTMMDAIHFHRWILIIEKGYLGFPKKMKIGSKNM